MGLIRALLSLAMPIGVLWVASTFWVELRRVELNDHLGSENRNQQLLVLYQPDPIYPLDAKVAQAFSAPFAAEGWSVDLRSPSNIQRPDPSDYELVALIANTYNWRPDWPTVAWIRQTLPANKPVVAITLGAGSTGASQRHLEAHIKSTGAELLQSEAWWLLRPNDEDRMDDSNVDVAADLAAGLARRILGSWTRTPPESL